MRTIQSRSAGDEVVSSLIRRMDWSASPLGAPETWPQSLRSVVDLMLGSKFPMFVAWGPELGFIYNDAYAEILSAKHPAALGSRFRDIWSEIWCDISPLVEAAMRGQATFRQDLPLVMNRRGFDEQTWFTFSYSPVRNDLGEIAGMFCAVAETTEKVLAERRQAFRSQLEEDLRGLADPIVVMARAAELLGRHLEVGRVGYGEADADGEYLNVARDWTDGAMPSLAGRLRLDDFGEGVTADYRAGKVVRVDDVLTDPRTHDSVAAYAAIGGPRAGIGVPLLKEGQLAAVLFIHQSSARRFTPDDEELVREVADRTWSAVERAQAEAALRESEENLRERAETLEQRVAEALAERQVLADFVDSTDVAVLACDLGFGILAINDATVKQMERVYGFRPKVGDNLLDLLAVMPEHRAQVNKHWGRALSGEEFVILDEFGDPGHERVYYEVRFHSLRDRMGKQIGAFQAASDVTDRVRAAAELETAQGALRQSQKMEAMGQLTGGVAHDFNNLLTPIVGSLDMLQRRGIGGQREQRLIAAAAQSAERAKTLVQRLLAFARRQPLQAVAVDVAKLVRDMGDLVASTTGPQIEVVVQIAEDLPAAEADPNQLEMAILNLSVNARDAMPHGGTLRISATPETLGSAQVAGLKQGAYVKLSVADTGSGMDETTLARAVEPFFSTKGVGKGTGLGLSMVHGLASQLGGALIIQSRPGLGTNVELWLPRSSSAPKALAAKTLVPNEAGACGRALLVDDEELVRLSTADMLIDLGFSVIEAASAEEALQLVNEGKGFDLLITDHLMPGMNGTDLARAVRSFNQDVPVLLISGYPEREGLDADLPRLTKPFRKDELASSLSQLAACGFPRKE